MDFVGNHILSVNQFDRADVERIFAVADGMRPYAMRKRITRVLEGAIVSNMFFEPSTRTRVSFGSAFNLLGGEVRETTEVKASSLAKGESLLDTAQTLDAMQADAVIIRHAASGAPHFISERISARVINAGDGMHEHPTQALLDMKTIRDHFGKVEGLDIAIIGDIAHSRVARSNLIALSTCGATLRVAGPQTVLPRELASAYGCTVCKNVTQAIEGAHVVMALRLQKERMTAGLLPNMREYAIEFGINAKMLESTRPDAILMHPGPVNRGVELSPDVVDGPRSVILDQVENGVAVRCAVLYSILGGETP